ncbi:alkane hydroxylase MAH1-like [Ananas comosus]|uniref:Alkane hydroxylase MAH1-like n=3 Tax=Ananas comosus TaxID=4615 RepID=A0A6P5F483_ANACO|nr:alkane hydroxylase MAH1-like [Ananas comosus]
MAMDYYLQWLVTPLTLAKRYPEILLSIPCFLFLHHLNRRRRMPVNWPVLGVLPSVLANYDRLLEWSTDVLRLAGRAFVFKGPWASKVDVLLTCDPDDVRYVFTANFANYPKGREFAAIFDVLGDGIFNADRDSWAFQRKKAHALMAEPKFRAFVAQSTKEKLEKGLVPLLSHLAEGNLVFDLQDVFLRLTFDTTAMFVFGFDPGCLSVDFPTVPFAKAMDDVEEVLFSRHVTPHAWWKLQRRLNVGHYRKMATATKVIDESIAQYIAMRREAKNSSSGGGGGQRGYDLLGSYLDSEEEVGREMAHARGHVFERFVRDTALNFMVAGRDTTSSALTWFFWLVAHHPDVESRIVAELTRHAPANHPAQLHKLVYTHAALCESLRLFPPVPFEHKSAAKPDTLPSGVHVHRQQRIMFSLYAMARMEGIWGADCMDFKPERWLVAGGEKIRHVPSYVFLAFNTGPRTCLGKDLAFTQMKAVVAAVIGNFRVEVARGHVARPKLSIILHMKGGLKVSVRKREKL